MMFISILVAIIADISFSNEIHINENRFPSHLPFSKIYEQGVASYLDERWFECTVLIGNAIDTYKTFKENIIDCRIKCDEKIHKKFVFDNKTNTNTNLSGSDTNKNSSYLEFHQIFGDNSQLRIFEYLIDSGKCMETCRRSHDINATGATPEIMKQFNNKKPYDYLQICAFKSDQIKHATAAAYTNFLANRDNNVMLQNLQYYREMPSITDSDFINLDEKLYQTHYINGMKSYQQENWDDVIYNFETALEEFYKEEKRCSAECIDRPDIHSGIHTVDVFTQLADIVLNIVECQETCESRLASIHGDQVENYVAEHYHYLQYAYYKLSDIKHATMAVASFLLFQPNDEVMLANKIHYVAAGVSDDKFVPSLVAVNYKNHVTGLSQLISLWRGNGKPSSQQMSNSRDHRAKKLKSFESMGISVFANLESDDGPQRFAADGFLLLEQCNELINMLQVKYGGIDLNMQDMGVEDVTELLKEKKVNDIALRILLRVSDLTREFTKSYLNTKTLFFHNTQLVCRKETQLEEMEKDCMAQEDGVCVYTFPRHTDDVFVAVLHLNKIASGGEMFTANPSLDGKGLLTKPMCGRLVGCSADVPHTVYPYSLNVNRCAIVYTFTTDSDKADVSTLVAHKYLEGLEEQQTQEYVANERDNPEHMKKVLGDDIEITYTVKELGGTERFVADGLASTEQCINLIELAQHAALVGDGYLGANQYQVHTKESPHTENEIFQGLSVYRAMKLVEDERIDKAQLELFLQLSDHGREVVEQYFHLKTPLYFDFTHLVCRMPVDGSNLDREDLSHPVHADNCALQPDGTCLHIPPYRSQRHYTGLIYLNDDFVGGKFFFAHANKSEQVAIQPQCGRLVGFSASDYHGVRAVLQGQRCALAMWYTLDLNYRELSRVQAWNLLTSLASREKDDSLKSKGQASRTQTEL